ncbi:hypothetical protein FOZ61_001462 [Perkinsus olseni]|uniref:Uncharacterized protein n=1 Tax=Perkinsus olseni TaxID=32597 RepID=A0A7J6KRV7_PEROL|nr:hypothetical protein FOZ61_001462 [Perkinsus olseni]
MSPSSSSHNSRGYHYGTGEEFVVSSSSRGLRKAISASLSSSKAYPSSASPQQQQQQQQGRRGRLVRNKTTSSLGRSMKKDRWNRGYRLPGRRKRGPASSSSSCNSILIRGDDGDDNMGRTSKKAGGEVVASSSSRLDDNKKYTYKPHPHSLNNNEVFDDADTYEVHTPEEWLQLMTREDNNNDDDDEEEEEEEEEEEKKDYHDMMHNGYCYYYIDGHYTMVPCCVMGYNGNR